MWIDIIVAVLLVLAIIKGYKKGLIFALFSIVAFIVGLAAALKLSAIVAGHLKGNSTASDRWLPFITFIAVFFVTVLLVRWGGRLIEKTFQLVLLGWLNRIGGMVLYALLYMIILGVFLFYAEKLQLLQPSDIRSSQTYTYFHSWGPGVIDGLGKIIPFFKDMFTELEKFFDGLSNKFQH
jgi:membrane protein required for colicin V production